MNKIFTVLSCCLLSITAFGQLQTDSLLRSYTLGELQAVLTDFGVPPGLITLRHEVDLYRLKYTTPDVHGVPSTASGAVAVPKGVSCALPLGSYQHGTVMDDDGVPSRISYEANIGVIMASMGYVVNMPDYLGLGDSPGLHPYVHAKSEASAVIDMIYATREFANGGSFNLNGQVFLFGYSQGGHSTMAAFKEIEANHPDITVTACAPMSGPYDISGAQASYLTSPEPYSVPAYAPYVILSYQEAYGNLYDSIQQVLREPYATDIPPLFYSGDVDGYDINSMLPSVVPNMIQPDMLAAYLADENHPFRVALRDNDLYDWKPVAPLHMFYCSGDDQVSYLNTENAYNKFIANGATQVWKSNFGDLDHGGCVQPSLMIGLSFIRSYSDWSGSLSTSYTTEPPSSPSTPDGSIDLEVTGGTGPYTYLWSNGQTTQDLEGVTSGNYSVTITDDSKCLDIVTVSMVLSSTTPTPLLAAQIYPNPASSVLTIDLPSEASGGQIALFDVLGQPVQYISHIPIGGGHLYIPVAHLPAGVYQLRIAADQKEYIGRFTVTH